MWLLLWLCACTSSLVFKKRHAKRADYVWRAGLTFLPTPLESSFSSQHIDSSPASNKKVIILGGEGSIVRFLKKENKATEKRITFGDPTREIDQAIRISVGKVVETTSRSARTIRGVLNILMSS